MSRHKNLSETDDNMQLQGVPQGTTYKQKVEDSYLRPQQPKDQENEKKEEVEFHLGSPTRKSKKRSTKQPKPYSQVPRKGSADPTMLSQIHTFGENRQHINQNPDGAENYEQKSQIVKGEEEDHHFCPSNLENPDSAKNDRKKCFLSDKCKRTTKIAAIVIVSLVILIPILVKIIVPTGSVYQSFSSTKTFIHYAIEKIFFDLEKETWIKKMGNQIGVATVIYASYSYDPKKGRLLTESEYRALPIGFIDLYDQTKGVVVRAQNPENFVFYIELQKIVDAYNVASAQTNRLLSQTGAAGRQLQADAASLKKYISDAINATSAELMEVPQSRIIVEEKTFWMGRLVNGNYEISTATQPAAQTTSGQTAAELNKTAWSVVNTVLRPILSEKMDYLNDYGTLIADKLSFTFDRYTEIYATYQKSTTMGKEPEPIVVQQTNSTKNGTNGTTNSTVFKPPRPPIIITTEHVPILSIRPYNVKDSRTMAQQTYEFVMNCTDYNQTVKMCSPETWLNPNSPYEISEQSLAKKKHFTSYTVYQVRVEPLPDDQVVQKPPEPIDMESFSSGSDSFPPPSEYTPTL